MSSRAAADVTSARVVLALVAGLSAGGVGVASAIAPPRLLHLDGLMKAQCSERLARCIDDAGWRTVVLGERDAGPIRRSSGLGPVTSRVVRTFVTDRDEPRAGRAISTCEGRIAVAAGEAIVATPRAGSTPSAS